MPSDPTELAIDASIDDDLNTRTAAGADIVEIAGYRRSRYERNSRALPHLGDDPDWTPSTFDLPTPISDESPQRWFDRFRR
jgi:hypothetical protein